MRVASSLKSAIENAELIRSTGRVRRVTNISIEATGPIVRLGDICRVVRRAGLPVEAEVVAINPDHIVLMPYQSPVGISVGDIVEGNGQSPQVKIDDLLLGRVIDGMGKPIDGKPLGAQGKLYPLQPEPINPLSRASVSQVLETGVRAIDGFLTLGLGQRVGIFAGSGVGKSTLLGMLAEYVKCDVMVVALIGERGREVQSFVESSKQLLADRRIIIVAATSDQPALVRRRAAYLAHSISEYFRDQGQHVCLLMDSITRVAMAQREIGLAGGELPTSRGYTPSVFQQLPKLLERPGPLCSGGSITAIYTVLVDGDDMNEPIADAVRATLDGHIVLSREIAQRGRYPAVDLTQSISRLSTELRTGEERRWISKLMASISEFEQSRDLIELGAYKAGTRPELDEAIAVALTIEKLIAQSREEKSSRQQTDASLRAILQPEGVKK